MSPDQESSSFFELAKKLAQNPEVQQVSTELRNRRSFYREAINQLLQIYIPLVLQRAQRFYLLPELESWVGGDSTVQTEHELVTHPLRKDIMGLQSKEIIEDTILREVIFYFRTLPDKTFCLVGFESGDSIIDLESLNPKDIWQIENWERAYQLICTFYTYDSEEIEKARQD